jgi:hypothetical protein
MQLVDIHPIIRSVPVEVDSEASRRMGTFVLPASLGGV